MSYGSAGVSAVELNNMPTLLQSGSRKLHIYPEQPSVGQNLIYKQKYNLLNLSQNFDFSCNRGTFCLSLSFSSKRLGQSDIGKCDFYIEFKFLEVYVIWL